MTDNDGTLNLQLKAKAFGIGIINPEERYKEVILEDIPLMITKNNKILCIPNTDEVKHIGSTGMTGSGKSVSINALLSWDYWLCGRDCLVLNDMQKETFEWSLPNNTLTHHLFLKQINTKPCSKPMVYVFPSTNTLKLEQRDKKFPYLKMTLPMEEVMKRIKQFFSLDKTEIYLNNLLPELERCCSIGEIRDVINENIPEKHEMMKYKIMNIFESLFNDQILNVSASDCPAWLDYRDGKGGRYYNYTIQVLMRCGLIPSIQTYDLINHKFFSPYIAFIVDAVYNNQYYNEYFKKRVISLFVDEIDKLWLGDNGDSVKQQLGLIGTNGRAARIGLRWSTQNYEKVPTTIRSNTKFLIVFRKKDEKEVAEIRKDFNIPKSMDKDILNLKKDPAKGIFEVVALTTESFVTYDLTTGKKEYTSEPQQGLLIPPQSAHRIPVVSRRSYSEKGGQHE